MVEADTTEENIQARIRGLLLMALSNKSGKMVLATSNKSESAVGYATLYGDMCGGLSVLKDVLKTQVYALAGYRNSISPVIPRTCYYTCTIRRIARQSNRSGQFTRIRCFGCDYCCLYGKEFKPCRNCT